MSVQSKQNFADGCLFNISRFFLHTEYPVKNVQYFQVFPNIFSVAAFACACATVRLIQVADKMKMSCLCFRNHNDNKEHNEIYFLIHYFMLKIMFALISTISTSIMKNGGQKKAVTAIFQVHLFSVMWALTFRYSSESLSYSIRAMQHDRCVSCYRCVN